MSLSIEAIVSFMYRGNGLPVRTIDRAFGVARCAGLKQPPEGLRDVQSHDLTLDLQFDWAGSSSAKNGA
jgi:hypothetical protein